MFEKIFTYDVVYEACGECFAFGNIKMLKDFGPLKQGEEIGSIWFDLNSSAVIIYGEDGVTKIKEFPFFLMA